MTDLPKLTCLGLALTSPKSIVASSFLDLQDFRERKRQKERERKKDRERKTDKERERELIPYNED